MNNWDEVNANKKLFTGLSVLRDQELLKDRNINLSSLKGKD